MIFCTSAFTRVSRFSTVLTGTRGHRRKGFVAVAAAAGPMCARACVSIPCLALSWQSMCVCVCVSVCTLPQPVTAIEGLLGPLRFTYLLSSQKLTHYPAEDDVPRLPPDAATAKSPSRSPSGLPFCPCCLSRVCVCLRVFFLHLYPIATTKNGGPRTDERVQEKSARAARCGRKRDSTHTHTQARARTHTAQLRKTPRESCPGLPRRWRCLGLPAAARRHLGEEDAHAGGSHGPGQTIHTPISPKNRPRSLSAVRASPERMLLCFSTF